MLRIPIYMIAIGAQFSIHEIMALLRIARLYASIFISIDVYLSIWLSHSLEKAEVLAGQHVSFAFSDTSSTLKWQII